MGDGIFSNLKECVLLILFQILLIWWMIQKENAQIQVKRVIPNTCQTTKTSAAWAWGWFQLLKNLGDENTVCSELAEILQMSKRKGVCLSLIQLKNHLAVGLLSRNILFSLSSLFRLLDPLIIYRLQGYSFCPDTPAQEDDLFCPACALVSCPNSVVLKGEHSSGSLGGLLIWISKLPPAEFLI